MIIMNRFRKCPNNDDADVHPIALPTSSALSGFMGVEEKEDSISISIMTIITAITMARMTRTRFFPGRSTVFELSLDRPFVVRQMNEWTEVQVDDDEEINEDDDETARYEDAM